MTELERLAKVLATVTFDAETSVTLNNCTTFFEGTADDVVRAILLAMREPSEAQYDALCATDKMWRELDSKVVWQTYIDSILNGGE